MRVAEEVQLGFFHRSSNLGILHGAEKGAVSGHAKLELVEHGSRFLDVAAFEFFSRIASEIVTEIGLLAVKILDLCLVAVELLILANRDWSGDDQRSPCFINENRVNLIDEGEVVISLHLHRRVLRHAVVSQVVEAKFAGGTVGDVFFVHLPTQLARLVILDTTDSESEPFKEIPHPLGVASSEVVVHGDDVNSHPGESVEKDGERCDESFTLTGCHFRNHAAVKSDTSNKLNVEVHHLPLDRMIADVPLLTAETASRVFHNGVCLG